MNDFDFFEHTLSDFDSPFDNDDLPTGTDPHDDWED